MTDLKTCPIEPGVTPPENCKKACEQIFNDIVSLRDKVFETAMAINDYSDGAVGRIEFPIGTKYLTCELVIEADYNGDVVCHFCAANENPSMCSVTKCGVKGDDRGDGKVVFWDNKE